MQVTVEVMGPIRSHLPQRRTAVVSLPPDATVADALRAVGVPEDERWNASVEGQLVDATHPLRDGDRLLVFAPIAGGCRQLTR
ncbi:MAG: MoaD/ThiS family protein [Armatimonadota bacterium]|nr:MoaD/ThiS family protein [Armatimonadota bacterium]